MTNTFDKLTRKFSTFYLLLFFYTAQIQAVESVVNNVSVNSSTNAQCKKNYVINYTIHPIFDENAPDAIWLHSFANFLHINTKEFALNNELGFLPPCELQPFQIEEVERYLRNLNYIRAAKVTSNNSDNQQQVFVETWDNWSMMPTIDFGRKGGENQYAFGIKDRNLVGLGIDAQLEYFSNAQRSGYQVKVNTPLYLHQNTYANFIFVDSDDGVQKAIILRKPFVSLTSRQAGRIEYNNETRIDNIFQNGETINRFHHRINENHGYYGFSDGIKNNHVWRYLIGFSKEQHEFESISTAIKPLDRDFISAWVGYEFIENDFKKLKNIYLINKIEDINFGWSHQARFGLIHDYTPKNAQFSWQFSSHKASQLSTNLLNVSSVEFKGIHYQQANDLWKVALTSELFYSLNEQWRIYGKTAITLSENQTIDQPVTFGGDSGIRGIPLQYQHGQHNALLSVEARYYPNINVYKLFELGAVAFIDIGKAYGNSEFQNTDPSLLKSIGIGARLYSTHASDSNVVHIDIAHPMGDSTTLNSIEFRLEVEHYF